MTTVYLTSHSLDGKLIERGHRTRKAALDHATEMVKLTEGAASVDVFEYSSERDPLSCLLEVCTAQTRPKSAWVESSRVLGTVVSDGRFIKSKRRV